MQMSKLKEFIKGEGVKHVVIEYEGIQYEVQEMYIMEGPPSDGRSKHGNTLVLQHDRFDEIDESGVTGADFV